MGARGAARGGSGRSYALAPCSDVSAAPTRAARPLSVGAAGGGQSGRVAPVQVGVLERSVLRFSRRRVPDLLVRTELSAGSLVARTGRDGPSTYATSITPTVYRGS